MARRVTPLTDKKVKSLKPTGKETIASDGKGLQLRIMPNGTKSCRFVYKSPATGKRSNMTLGKYPELSIANARKIIEGYRELVALEIDPKHHRREGKKRGYTSAHTIQCFTEVDGTEENRSHRRLREGYLALI